MTQRLKRIGGTFLLILFLIGILQLQFGDVMKGGHDRFFVQGGDGFKNYATVIYHVKHDKDWLHYTGMNYPYGEHVLFTDNQPLLANTIKYISNYTPQIADEIAPIMHWMMFISFIICGVFLLLIFRKYDIPDWFAIPVTIGIVWLSPQLLRISGHFGLAYAVVLPMYMYLLLLFEEKNKLRDLIFLFLTMFLFAQIHFYYFGILALMTFAYAFFRVIFAKADSQLNRQVWQQSGMLVGITLLSYGLLKWWTTIGNTVTDRPSHPMGFLFYRAHWESIFLNQQAPFLKFINERLIEFQDTPFEGNSYIGIVTVLIVLSLSYRWIKEKGRKTFFVNIDQHKLFFRSLFATAIAMLLFAMGFPFTIPGFEQFLNYLGPISQLRSVGRFGWIFFYTINLFGFIHLFNLYRADITNKSIRFLLLFPILLLLSDASIFLNQIPNKLHKLTELNREFNKSNQYWFKDINPDDYQAILPLPYFHVGSENLGMHTFGGAVYYSTVGSLWSGLPNMGVMMSRTSFSQSVKSISMIIAPGYRFPKILQDLPSQKPLLAFVDKESINHRPAQLNFILSYGEKVFDTDKVIGYRLELDAFAKAVAKNKQSLENELNTKPLFSHGSVLSTDSIKNYLYFSYDDLDSQNSYYSKGALPINQASFAKEKKQTIFDDQMPEPKKGKQYNLSFWVYINHQLGPHVAYRLYEYTDNDPSREVANWDKGVRFDMKNLDNGWAYISEVVTLQADNSKIKIDMYNNSNPSNQFWVDELIFRPVGTDLYQKEGTTIWKNGQFYE